MKPFLQIKSWLAAKLKQGSQKKPVVVAAFLTIALVVTAAVGHFVIYKDSGARFVEENGVLVEIPKELVEEMKIVDEAGVEINSADSTDELIAEIQKKASSGQSSQAIEQAKSEINSSDISAEDRDILYANLNQLCTQAQDLGCAEFVLNYKLSQTDNDTLRFWLYIPVARLAKAVGNQEKSREYSQKALEIVDSKGGKTFIDELNNSDIEEVLVYEELVNAAR